MNDRARDEETFRVATNSEADLHLVAAKLDAIDARLASLDIAAGS